MDLPLILLALLWGFSARSRGESPGDIKPSRPRQLPAPSSPSGGGLASTVPSGLPAFPGSGWEYDEPPPREVVQRAGQLVSQLWRGGAGSFTTEQTGGRWIIYQAAKVASGKQGVVAFRVKRARAIAPAPNSTARRSPAPASRRPRATPASSTSSTPFALEEIRRGMGLKPQKPNEAVMLAQRKLNEKNAAGLTRDGRFGELTEKAVKAYQAKRGLPATGIVDAATWRALYAVQSA